MTIWNRFFKNTSNNSSEKQVSSKIRRKDGGRGRSSKRNS